ncbi:MAG: ATP-dependent DNA helicase [Proteobacteria bacterium]|nr:ATP-dependent DNA helicase [Pseudomonadota bacterium]
MALAVEAALAARGRLVVEAGTGTGKTFAYLLPAILSGRRVIVSTGTRTLQDQLYHRDLPAVSAAIGRPVRVALLKGRANYLCRHRLALAHGAGDELPGLARQGRRMLARIDAWARITSTGDTGELESVPDTEPLWSQVTSTRDNCLGQDCPEFRDCHVVAARRAAQAADLVIVNHHLLLADLALKEEGFGELLPGADAVILDEAHQFPDVAAQFFGTRVASRPLLALARDTLAELTRAGLLDGTARATVEALEGAVATLGRVLAGLGERIDWPLLPDAALEAAHELARALAAAAERFGEPALESAGVRQCGRRALEAGARLTTILESDPGEGLRWAESEARGYSLEWTPFEVAARLRAHFDARPCAWVCTSATLAVDEDFSHFTGRMGLGDADCLRVPSPFDYENQARLYLPRGLPAPADPGYTAALIEAALPLVRAAGGRSFLLFTSYRALGEGTRRLRAALGPGDAFPVLVQGEAPRDALLRRFRELGNAVLLGTGSFWEGVDVRGPALSLVAIDKLPFAAPDDPLLKARLEGLKRAGRNGFLEYQVPQAVLALKQGVGRLIRDPDDFGVVLLGDPRLTTKGYGRAFLASLPPMGVTRERDEAVAFLRHHLGSLAPTGTP